MSGFLLNAPFKSNLELIFSVDSLDTSTYFILTVPYPGLAALLLSAGLFRSFLSLSFNHSPQSIQYLV